MVKSDGGKSGLMLVPETILKRRHDLDELRRKQAAAGGSRRNGKSAKGFYVKKPETFLANARSRRNYARRLMRVAKKGMQKRASNEKVFETRTIEQNDGEALTVKLQTNSVGTKLVFVVRIRGDIGAPMCVKRILRRMRLNENHNGVFLKYTEDNRKRLHMVEPFVVYGKPSKGVVKDLIERHGHGSVLGERVPLSDNTLVEEHLGDHNVICLEDIVHEIHTVGDCFFPVNKFLWPFRLLDSKTEFERKTLKLTDGKNYGDKGEEIDEYLKQVL